MINLLLSTLLSTQVPGPNLIVNEWDSGYQSTMAIRIVDANVDGLGNDFALDDLSLVAKPIR